MIQGNNQSVVPAQQIVSTPPIFYGLIAPGSSVDLQARITDDNANALLPANVSSISIVITDMMADTAAAPITITPSAAIASTLTAWPIDNTGYNASLSLNGSYFTGANTTYQVVATLSTTAGTIVIVWNIQTNIVI